MTSQDQSSAMEVVEGSNGKRIDGGNGRQLARTTHDGQLSVDRRAVTKRTRLDLPQGLPIGAWQNLGRQIFVISDSSGWWLGDWLIYGQSHYPDRYRRAILGTSLDYQTLRNYAWVARQFVPSRRRERLSFQHHAEVASMSQEQQEVWLDRAEVNGWSRNELRRQIKAHSRRGQPNEEGQHIQMSIPLERKQRWEAAADGAQQDLLAWMVTSLDHAAERALEGAIDGGGE